MQIYNTATRHIEELKPQTLTWYNCGPTVYDYIHIGNARNAVVMDFLRRYLTYRSYKVTFIQNYTDIDDKMINKAKELGIPVKAVAEKYIKTYETDVAHLGVTKPDITPKATDHIKDMITLIQQLIANNVAYETEDGVYFSVQNHPSYGALSGQSIDKLKEGARVTIDEKKKDPLDFALWKKEKPGEPPWDSPWGKGRPGWHIECSVMSTKYADGPIDIHSGGVDLTFPHHENELAQYLGAGNKTFVTYWIHNAFLNIDKEKMSKSLGNVLLAKDAIKEIGADVLRYFFVSTHYRTPIDYSADALQGAKGGLFRYQQFYRTNKTAPTNPAIKTLADKTRNAFIAKMDHDFNAPEAFGILFEFIREANSLGTGKEAAQLLEELDTFLGLLDQDIALTTEQETLVKQREQARERKNWQEADAIRDKLKEQGVLIEDIPEGTRVRRA